MQVGFTTSEATDMFTAAKAEVFGYFGYTKMLSFRVVETPPVGFFTEGAMAHCTFALDPDKVWKRGDATQDFASGIRMNGTYLPYLYEDELRNIFLHELTHAVADRWAAHTNRWASLAAEVGAVPSPYMMIRNWDVNVPERYREQAHRNYMLYGATMDAWAMRTI